MNRTPIPMNRTPIPWVKNPDGSQGYTWNPITGCLNGCEYCYARKLANGRLRTRYLANENILSGYTLARGVLKEDAIPPSLDPFYPRFWEDRECSPIRRNIYKGHKRQARGIFTCDMSDLFGIGIPEEWTRHILTTIQCCPIDRFYLLTKQPQNLIKFSPFPDNCWVGVTVTNKDMLEVACSSMIGVQARVKYLSIEPLLERLTPSRWLYQPFHWVIIGSQTKPYKPPEIEWVEEIVNACDIAGVPVFLKNNLEKMCWDSGFEKIKDLSFWERIDHADDMVMAVDFRQEMPTIH